MSGVWTLQSPRVSLEKYQEDGVVIVPNKFNSSEFLAYVRYANDNININEETRDGKGTLRQTAALPEKHSG